MDHAVTYHGIKVEALAGECFSQQNRIKISKLRIMHTLVKNVRNRNEMLIPINISASHFVAAKINITEDDKKKGLTESLVSVMKTNKIDCFDITGGSLVYKKNTLKKPLNSKTLLSVLQKYYKNDAKVAEELTKHIMDSREEHVKETIQMKGF